MFYEGIESGKRTSDIRYTDDRTFRVGDHMLLKEFDPVTFTYTGREQKVEITYIQTNMSNPCAISPKAMADNVCVLSIKKL